MDEWHRPHSIFWPLLLIAAGVFLLLNALGMIQGDFWGIFLRLWPLLFIVGGLDSLYRRESFVGPVLFIGLGTVLLLGNLNYIQLASWTVFLRLWPVIIIAIGLDILIGHRSAWSAVLGVLLGLVLVGGIIWYATTLPEARAGVTTERITQELGGAQEADVELDQIFGELNVSGGAAQGNLVEGEVQMGRGQTYLQDYKVQGQRGVYTLGSTTADAYIPFLNPATSLVWHLDLSGDVPLALETNLVIGVQRVDLTGLQVERLESNVVIGQNTLVLSDATLLEGRTSTVIGQVVVIVPRDLPVRLRLNTAITGISFPDEFTRDDGMLYSQAAAASGEAVELEVNLPIGSVLVKYDE